MAARARGSQAVRTVIPLPPHVVMFAVRRHGDLTVGLSEESKFLPFLPGDRPGLVGSEQHIRCVGKFPGTRRCYVRNPQFANASSFIERGAMLSPTLS